MLKGAPEIVVGYNKNPSHELMVKEKASSKDELKLHLKLIAQIRQEINEIKDLQKELQQSLRQLEKNVHLQQLQTQQQKNFLANNTVSPRTVPAITPQRMRELKLNRHHRIMQDCKDKQLSPAFSLHNQKSSGADSMKMKAVETKSKHSQSKKNKLT